MKKRISDLERIIAERRDQKRPSVLIVKSKKEAAERAGEVRSGGTIIINDLQAMRGYVERQRG